MRLPHLFAEVGLGMPDMRQHDRVANGPNAGVYAVFIQGIRRLWPRMEQFGVAPAREVDIDTLEVRLPDEAVAPPFIGAWARKP